MAVRDGEATEPGGGGQEGDIRDKVRELTAQVLSSGRVDPKGVEEVVRSMTAAATGGHAGSAPEPRPEHDRKALLEDLERLDRALEASAGAARAALAQIASKGVDFTDNDLKEAFARLRDLQQTYVDTVNRVADAATGNVQRELRSLAGHAQQVGADAGARAAALMTEFANRLGAASRKSASTGFDAARDYGMRMSMLASGVLAGIADGLREQGEPRRGPERSEETER